MLQRVTISGGILRLAMIQPFRKPTPVLMVNATRQAMRGFW